MEIKIKTLVEMIKVIDVGRNEHSLLTVT